MGSVEFVTWDGGGNVNVVVALTERLTGAGWDVGVYAPPSVGDRVVAAGARFTPREVADPWDVAAMARDVQAHCGQVAPDAVVVDYMLPGALCGAEATGRPTAALVHTLYGALLDGGAPSPMGMAASPGAVDEARATVGLGPVAGLGGLLDGCARVLVTCPAALDVAPDGAGLPGNVRYVGAALEGAGPDAGWVPPGAPASDGEAPLVVVALGTTPMDEGPVLQAVLDALAEAPVRVLAMLGAHLTASDLDVPANATVTGYVRHAAVLPHASALVTHAGLGTVLAALAHGVPLVCVPLGREQPDNAAAVARLGAGVTVARSAVPSSLGRAVLDALVEPAYRSAAQEMAAAISAAPADAVERELAALTAVAPPR
jgi:Erythromycin biosynthesis protein CIII-like, C-terminal domain